jgi:hypothetical protein
MKPPVWGVQGPYKDCRATDDDNDDDDVRKKFKPGVINLFQSMRYIHPGI